MSKQTFRPLGDGIVIKPTPPAEVTKSGLIIPKNAQEKTQVGTVEEIGGLPFAVKEKLANVVLENISNPEASSLIEKLFELFALNIKKGDTVLYGKHAGLEIEVDGQGYLLMKYVDLYGIFENVESKNE